MRCENENMLYVSLSSWCRLQWVLVSFCVNHLLKIDHFGHYFFECLILSVFFCLFLLANQNTLFQRHSMMQFIMWLKYWAHVVWPWGPDLWRNRKKLTEVDMFDEWLVSFTASCFMKNTTAIFIIFIVTPSSFINNNNNHYCVCRSVWEWYSVCKSVYL